MASKVLVSKKLLAVNSASNVLAQLLNAGAMLWVIQHLLNVISKEEYQILPVIMGVMMFPPLLSMIVTSGVARYVTEAYARNDMERVSWISNTMLVLTMGAGLILLVAGGVLAWFIGDVLDIDAVYLNQARIMMALLMASMAISVALMPLGVGVYVRQRFVFQNSVRMIATLIRAGLMLALVLGVSPRVMWIVVANVAGNMFEMVANQLMSLKLVPELRLRLGRFDWNIARQIGGFGTWLSVGRLAGAIRMGSDPIVLNKLADATQVNTFNVANIFEATIRQQLFGIVQPLLPMLTGIYVTDQHERLGNAYLRGGRILSWIAMFVATPLIVYHREVMRLYLGPAFNQYPDAPLVLLLLMGTIVIGTPSHLIWAVANATAKVRFTAGANIIIQLLNLALTIALVGWLGMGAIGSATSTLIMVVIGQVAVMIPLGAWITATTLSQFVRKTLIPGLGPCLLTAIVMFASRLVYSPDSWTGLLAVVAVCCAIYTVLVACVFADKADRYDMATLLGRLTGRRTTAPTPPVSLPDNTTQEL